ncbi:MAG TPA: LysM peptidoglycan-binding domain-containing protein [Geminicoccaceae bacterium]|nr:LysM peptidoglycan-binding domain-containing protein [Geminicoccaceae bacterium]
MQHTIQSGETLSRIAAAHGTTLERLLEANPRYRADPDRIRVGEVVEIPNGAGPGLAEAAPAFVPSPTRWILGTLSSKYETSGRGPGTVSTGRGDAGGVSYGSYQMTSRPNGGTVARFIAEPDFPWRARFAGLTPGADDFSARWRALAAEAGDAFFAAQHAYIQRTHFDPLVRRIAAEDGLLVSARSHAVQDAVWSTAVQHGPNAAIVHSALLALGGGQAVEPATRENDRKLIVAIYAERGRRDPDGALAHFRRNSQRVQESVAQRFVNEQRDALAMLDRSA